MSTSFPQPFSKELLFLLKTGDKIDYRGSTGKCTGVTVISKLPHSLNSILINSLLTNPDAVNRVFPAGSISLRPAHRYKILKIGDPVDVNPKFRYPDRVWCRAKIAEKCPISGQIRVCSSFSS